MSGVSMMLKNLESTGVTSEYDHRVKRARDLIQKLASEPIGVDAIVSRCGIGRRSLEQRFLKVTGTTLLEALNEERLSIAESYLRKRDLTLEAIAEKSGFSSGHYFSRIYKKRRGQTPGQYRSQH